MERHFTLIDKILSRTNSAMNALFTDLQAAREYPAKDISEEELTVTEKKHSEALMRINHVGEICAQALYQGQSCVAKDPHTEFMLKKASDEEIDHLAWTHQRLKELNGRRSYLNFFWYSNAFMIGVIAGLAGDQWSLGFVEETEAQVSEHLAGHLGELPIKDERSRAIVQQMKIDEERHGQTAKSLGAAELPSPIKKLMKLHAKVMTTIAYYI
jgi:ubiquinone biosynthesis monooxygenase Coq7